MDTQKIYQAISDVLKDVDAIGKDRKNQAQGYSFRGIDDVYNTLHPIFAKHGVFVTPLVRSCEATEGENSKGTVMRRVILTVDFKFYAVDGSSVTATTIGEGIDSSDKASNKAMSAALKYALFQTLLIPTEDQPDADATTPDIPKKKEPPKPPAPNLPQYADQKAFLAKWKNKLPAEKVAAVLKSYNCNSATIDVKDLEHIEIELKELLDEAEGRKE
jgi:hypothetical protein